MTNFTNTGRVGLMEEMAEDESVIFRSFLRKFKEAKGKMIFFFEGIDDLDYYFPIFESSLGPHTENWVSLVCFGRSNVFQLVHDLKCHTLQAYKESYHFGFVDKDYHEVEDNIFPEKIYVTPTYSIENFYVSMKFFKKILRHKFYLAENDSENDDFNLICGNFTSRRQEFVSQITELDALLRCNRIMYEENDIVSKINARDINLNNFIRISLNDVSLNTDAFTILGKSIEDFENSVLESSRQYYEGKDTSQLVKVIRGKFMFYFMHQYLFRLKEDNIKRNPSFFPDSYRLSRAPREERRIFTKTRLSLNKESQDILSDLCQFADVPSCLTDFLSHIRRECNENLALVS